MNVAHALSQIFKNGVKSPKTTIGGLIAGLCLIVPQVGNMLGHPTPMLNADGTPVLNEQSEVVYNPVQPVNWYMVIVGAGLIWSGSQGRDNDKSSEKAIA